jgi:tripartite-type tricarboxylate transporter receptor subunit TctC
MKSIPFPTWVKLVVGAPALFCAVAATAYAQDKAASYPSKPLRILVGYAPGGATDIVARLVGQKLHEAWGQPVIVDNKPGASSNIASEQAARATPDGYTLLLGTIANATNMSVYKKLNYDTMRSFVPVTQIMSAPSILVSSPSLQVTDLKGLIALAKSKPGTLTFASSGLGGTPHLAGEMLKMRSGIDMLHIPYKGAAQAMNDVLSGEVSVGFMTALSALPHMQSGRLKPLAVASDKRLPQLPNVPTMAEAGMADFEVNSWSGLLAPAGTPPEIVAKLNREVVKILAMPEIKAKFEGQAAEAVGSSQENFRTYIRTEIDKWATVVKASGAIME